MVNVTFGTADPASQLDQIYRNQGGTLTPWFRDSTRIGDDAQWGMGMDVADINHNGTWDIYISDLLWDTPLEEPPWGNVLYLGTPSGGFTDNQAPNAGVVGDDSWGVNFLDVDHDGWEDLYCLERPPNSRYSGFVGRVAYDGTEPRCSLQLLRNDSPKSGSWLQLRLVGTASNAAAIGAVVRVEVEGQTLMRQIVGGTGGTFAEQPDGPLRARTNRDGRYGRGPLAEWPANPLGQPAGQHADRGGRGRRLSRRRSGRLHRRGQRPVGLTSIELGA